MDDTMNTIQREITMDFFDWLDGFEQTLGEAIQSTGIN